MVKLKKGVVVMTLTATVYEENFRRTYSSRIGFAGEYNKAILSKMGEGFKKIYVEQIKSENKSPDVKRIVCRVSTKSTECEMLLSNQSNNS